MLDLLTLAPGPTTTTTNMSADVLRHQTRQILLEYFCLGNDNTYFNDVNGNDHTSASKEDTKKEHASVTSDVRNVDSTTEEETPIDSPHSKKFKTHEFSSDDLTNLQKLLAAHTKTENGNVFVRSKSFESRKYYTMVRGKMREMLNTTHENIAAGGAGAGDSKAVQTANNETLSVDPKANMRASRENLHLDLTEVNFTEDSSSLESATTCCVNLLEALSRDIMAKCPDILDQPRLALAAPLRGRGFISYATFSSVLIPLLQMQVSDCMSSILHNISLCMTVIKETMMVANIDEDMMEIMVDHSTNFFMENVADTVEEVGGWEALCGADDGDNVVDGATGTTGGAGGGKITEITNREVVDGMTEITSREGDGNMMEIENRCECSNTGMGQRRCRECRLRRNSSANNWYPVALALVGVGVGLAYTFRK